MYFSCMKTASLKEIQDELQNLPAEEMVKMTIRLAKFKRDNKEFLTYLLFESFDTDAYIESVKGYMENEFAELNTSNLYFAKKGLRRILRNTSKYAKYAGQAETEIRLLLHFCSLLNRSGISYHESGVLTNLYNNQLKKIRKSIGSLHEDLQYDYLKELEASDVI